MSEEKVIAQTFGDTEDSITVCFRKGWVEFIISVGHEDDQTLCGTLHPDSARAIAEFILDHFSKKGAE